jgi:hypothetical protein
MSPTDSSENIVLAFSDRIGITQPRTILQVEAMDDELRNGLWQACNELRRANVQSKARTKDS